MTHDANHEASGNEAACGVVTSKPDELAIAVERVKAYFAPKKTLAEVADPEPIYDAIARILSRLASQEETIRSLVDALAERDAGVTECPVNNPTPRNPHPGDGPCKRCRSRSSGSCGLMVSADHAFVGFARARLSARQEEK